MPLSRHTRFAIVALTLVAAVGCGSATTEPARRAMAAGTYVLTQASGQSGVSGSFVLTSNGRAVRRMRYAGYPNEYVQSGTFEISASNEIEFGLLDQAASPAYVWKVRGQWTGRRLSIRYPSPVDGPDIVETFSR